MFFRLLEYIPIFGPVFMVLLNLVIVCTELLCSGRLKVNAFMYTFRYAATIPAAVRGDLQPFLLVLTSLA
jgi:hypothetical protein